MDEHGRTETEVAIQNEFDASERYSEFGDYYARVAPTGELIGPYDSADERDDELRDAISEAIASTDYFGPNFVDAIKDSWLWVEEQIEMEKHAASGRNTCRWQMAVPII